MTDINISILEAGKSKIKVQADPVSGGKPLPGGQMIIFSLCPHVVDQRPYLLISLEISILPCKLRGKWGGPNTKLIGCLLLLLSHSVVSDSLQPHALQHFSVLHCLPEFAQTQVH